MKPVLSVTSECVPLIKTGGLGDVAFSLPNALVELGVDVLFVGGLVEARGQLVGDDGHDVVFDRLVLGQSHQQSHETHGRGDLAIAAPFQQHIEG